MTDRDIDEIEVSEDSDADAADEEWTEDADFDAEDELEDDEAVIEADDDAVVGDDDDDVAVVADDDDEDDDREALDELEAEELEMLTDDEESETLIVDEAEELRAIRRAELALESDGVGARAQDEFLCEGCFLVLKRSQLAAGRRSLCRDCAA